MNIKAIEIYGNLILLENVASVSAVMTNENSSFFNISYQKGEKIVTIKSYYLPSGTLYDFGNAVVIATDKPIEEIRNEIIKIVLEK